MAVERLLRAGFFVAVPIVDAGYDLLAFDSDRFWRLQVKASASRRSAKCCSRIRITRGRKRRMRYSSDDVHAIVACNLRTNQVLCVPVAATGGRRWLNWSESSRWSDFGILRSIESTASMN